jgi:predicted ribosome quality control (RQC) complex YloA/Tae2 family protein
MSLSQAEIALLIDEIELICGQATLQRILEPAPRRLVARFRSPGETHWLLLSTEQNATRLHFVDDKPDQPDHPSPFAMLCRKWLHGAAFETIEQIRGDRVVRLTFRTVDPRAEKLEDESELPRTSVHLLGEFAGRVGNLFLLDTEQRILGMQTDEAIGSRDFDVGDQWTPPPPPPESASGREVRWELASRDPDHFERSSVTAQAYAEKLKAAERDAVYSELESRLEDQIERLERRIEHVEQDLQNVEDADQYRRRAELLQSAYGEVERGSDSVTVPDFYTDGMPEVDVPLDPKKDLQENIEAYYHEARRYEDARERVESRLLESVELRDRASEELQDLRESSMPSLEELKQLRERLRSEGLLPQRNNSGETGDRPNRDDRSKPYRTFLSHSGRRILVGKGASDNDTLSTKVARGRDFWFHTRDWPGAHVLLRLENRDESPGSEDLVDAATLAAHFSKGRKDTSVEVTYTRAKHVRKHGDLPPGRVAVSKEKTIAVRMEEERLERLLESEQE